MDTEAVIAFCIELKTSKGESLNSVSDEIIRKVVVNVANTVNDVDQLYTRLSNEFGDMQLNHPQYGNLAARVIMSQLYRHTPKTFHDAMDILCQEKKITFRTWSACVNHIEEIRKLVREHNYADFNNFTYQGVNHLIKTYLLKDSNNKVVERPIYTMMRVAIGLNPHDFKEAKRTFLLLIDGTLALASPIIFNAGTTMAQMASCFIQTINGDSVEEKYESLKETAKISAMNGGVGINVDGSDTQLFNIVVDRTIKDVGSNGNKKRPCAGAVYREPWETDFLTILKNKRTEGGREDEKHKDLFIGMWAPSLFVRRIRKSVETGQPVMWSFFDGDNARELRCIHGKAFDDLYHDLETRKAYAFQLPVLEVFRNVCKTYKETGTPYTLFKDIVNRRSNHNNRGTIRGSNLCAEILEYSDRNETAVCTIASICVSKFLPGNDASKYDYVGLGEAVRVAVRNLNRSIIANKYPSDKTRKSHLSMRPIGIGPRDFQGLLLKAGLPFTSGAAKRLLDGISSQIYMSALDESCNQAAVYGKYDHFEGSMYHKGILQQDTTQHVPDFSCTICENNQCEFCAIDMHIPNFDWDGLREKIKKFGVFNSLVTAAMPTVGTSQIFGNYETVDPLDSLVYLSRVNSGTYQVVCRQLVDDLQQIGLWSLNMANEIVSNGGSISRMDNIPKRIRSIYKTVWEIKQTERIKMAAIMGRYIDQGISFNVNIVDPSNSKYLTLMLTAHDCDMKIANYYHRSKPATDAKKVVATAELGKVCKINDPSCMSCSS